MKYILLIHDEERIVNEMSPAQMEKLMGGFMKFGQELEAAGAHVASERLRPVATATTVRVRNGETVTTDGPFAETKEQLGGFYLIDVKDLDEAIKWASRIPSATFGCVEVRPIWEM